MLTQIFKGVVRGLVEIIVPPPPPRKRIFDWCECPACGQFHPKKKK